MINNERIVPIQVVDLLSMYGLILALTLDAAPTALAASDTDGDFVVSENSATLIANEPVKTLNFGEDVTAGTVYFVAAFGFTGFSVNGTAVETAGAEIEADRRTLYSATLADGAVTIAKIGF